jgi:serine/threonine protein kinase
MTSPNKRGFGPSTAHYEVLRVLGEGGFGKVWECVDVRAGGKQKWAVKQSKEASKQYPCQPTAYHAAVTGCVSSAIPTVAALFHTRCFASCCLPCLAVVSNCESGGLWEEVMGSRHSLV